jgi:hypothetical protein
MNLRRRLNATPGWRCGAPLSEAQAGGRHMKPITAAVIGALIVALGVVGYLYYQRTANDITIRPPKIEIKP